MHGQAIGARVATVRGQAIGARVATVRGQALGCLARLSKDVIASCKTS